MINNCTAGRKANAITLLLLLSLFTCVSVADADDKPLTLLGFDKMVKEINEIIVSKIKFKRRKKDGSPKYLHQLKEEVYKMKASKSGYFELKVLPEEWFEVKRVSDNEFTVQYIDPMNLAAINGTYNDFKISWQLDEIVD